MIGPIDNIFNHIMYKITQLFEKKIHILTSHINLHVFFYVIYNTSNFNKKRRWLFNLTYISNLSLIINKFFEFILLIEK